MNSTYVQVQVFLIVILLKNMHNLSFNKLNMLI